MKTFLQAELIAHIEVSDQDFDFIKKCCTGHYDFKVSETVKVGGFLYGATNRRQWAKDRNEENNILVLKFRQIDMLLKALEMGNYIDMEKAMPITKRFTEILHKINEKYSILNPALENEIL